MLFPEKETAERNFLYGYDVAESSSDVDATSSIVQTVQNQAPRQKYEDHRLKITWFACGITIYKPFFFSSLGFMVDIPNYLMGVINQLITGGHHRVGMLMGI